ncbi:MAG: hypothetical protein FJZ08_05630, partial [Candidatus Omnitrophica bacterium]|nr:hypothetical protein [Candidatus Omnitrophota bacterium]
MMEAWSPWETISPEAKLTLLIARSLVTPSYANKIEGFLAEGHLNWESFNQLAAYHELTPSAHIFLKSFPRLVSSDELRLLERYYYSNLLHLNLLQQELLKILDLFKKENIMVLPLKGAQFLLEEGVYGDLAYLRPMCDIDILIKKRDCLKSEGILESLGYKKELHGAKEEYWRNKGYHLGFVRQAQNKQFYIVEVHWDLDYKRSRPLLS